MDYKYHLIKSPVCLLGVPKDDHYFNIYYVLAGSVTMVREKSSIQYHQGDMFVLKPSTKKVYVESLKGKMVQLCINKAYFERYYVRNAFDAKDNFELYRHIKMYYIEAVKHRYQQEYFLADVAIIKLINYLRVYFDNFDNYLFRCTEDATINKILKYVNVNYKLPLKLCTIAEEFFLNESYLSRKFKEEMNMNYREYVRKVKLCNISENLFVVEQEGELWKEYNFPSKRAYIKSFKKHFEMAPKEFIIKAHKERARARAITDKAYKEILELVN